jgi:hypothetical protein
MNFNSVVLGDLLSLFIYAPTTKAVGSNFVTYSEPTGLPVGARINKFSIHSSCFSTSAVLFVL